VSTLPWIPPQSAPAIPWFVIEESLRIPQRSPNPFLLKGMEQETSRRAAVAVVLWGNVTGARELLIVQRGFGAPRHPGELAFPGGMVEPGDRDLPATARRELFEELGVKDDLWELGCLPDCVAKGEIRFTPVVFRWEAPEPHFEPNPEIRQGLHLPIQPLMEAPWTTEHFHGKNGRELIIPRLELAEAPLWGATAFVLKTWLDLLSEVLNHAKV